MFQSVLPAPSWQSCFPSHHLRKSSSQPPSHLKLFIRVSLTCRKDLVKNNPLFRFVSLSFLFSVCLSACLYSQFLFLFSSHLSVFKVVERNLLCHFWNAVSISQNTLFSTHAFPFKTPFHFPYPLCFRIAWCWDNKLLLLLLFSYLIPACFVISFVVLLSPSLSFWRSFWFFAENLKGVTSSRKRKKKKLEENKEGKSKGNFF